MCPYTLCAHQLVSVGLILYISLCVGGPWGGHIEKVSKDVGEKRSRLSLPETKATSISLNQCFINHESHHLHVFSLAPIHHLTNLDFENAGKLSCAPRQAVLSSVLYTSIAPGLAGIKIYRTAGILSPLCYSAWHLVAQIHPSSLHRTHESGCV